MSKSLVVVQDFMPLRTAAELMLKHKVGGLPVVSDTGQLVGILTVTDVLRAYLKQEQPARNEVVQVG